MDIVAVDDGIVPLVLSQRNRTFDPLSHMHYVRFEFSHMHINWLRMLDAN